MIPCDVKGTDCGAPSGVESLCIEPGWSVHIQPAIERTARIQAEELGGELHSTPRSLEEDTPTVETLGRGRPSSQRGASEEAPVRDVRAGSADRRREPQTTEGRGTQEPLRDLGPNIITEQEYSFTATAKRETVRDVKEKPRFTVLDDDTELTTNPTNSQTETLSLLAPNASVARKRCFSQSHWPPDSTTFFLRKTKCDVYIRKEVYATVVLSSGTTCAKGIVMRMTKELTMLGPSTMEIKAFRVSHEPTALNTQPDFRCFFKGSCPHHSCPQSQMPSTCWVHLR